MDAKNADTENQATDTGPAQEEFASPARLKKIHKLAGKLVPGLKAWEEQLLAYEVHTDSSTLLWQFIYNHLYRIREIERDADLWAAKRVPIPVVRVESWLETLTAFKKVLRKHIKCGLTAGDLLHLDDPALRGTGPHRMYSWQGMGLSSDEERRKLELAAAREGLRRAYRYRTNK